ncbi:uncharacterized protein LOC135076980 [Ostrinia nubilalis]|uniref:uncharacterized protein LOC135076980 n=1 Tax=Ostrinia nubilalis TaxID=29057 RepID=UPI003082616A
MMGHTSNKSRTTHTHQANTTAVPKEYIVKSEYIRTHNGRYLVFLNGFTYCKHYRLKVGARRWQCSMHASKNCSAHLIISDDGCIRRRNETHSHPPSKYYRNRDGSYIRVGVYKNG